MIKEGEFFVQILPNEAVTPNQDSADGIKASKSK